MKKVLLILLFISFGCQNNSKRADNFSNKGVGPITNVILEDKVNISMATSGEKLFNQLCTSCHMINEDYIGPAISGMLEEDPIAIELLEEYDFEYMYNQNLLEEEVREILEYFRLLD